jgi:hypothetical protein
METIVMTSKNLKIRAKRLRPAIEQMLGIKISLAQSLELVAKEENYPHWDAACASYEKPVFEYKLKPGVRDLTVDYLAGKLKTFSSVFAKAPGLADELISFLKSDKGGIVLLSCVTGGGMTTTIASIAEEVMRQGRSVDVYQFGVKEREYSDAIRWKEIRQGGTLNESVRRNTSVVFIDDIRCGRVANEAVTLAYIGMKVVIGIVSNDPVRRFKHLLNDSAMSAAEIEALEMNVGVMPIRQSLVFSSPEAQAMMMRESFERIRRLEKTLGERVWNVQPLNIQKHDPVR